MMMMMMMMINVVSNNVSHSLVANYPTQLTVTCGFFKR